MKILITGANGFLGQHLCAQLLAKGFHVLASGRGECRLPFPGNEKFQYQSLDFTDPFAVHDLFEQYQPTVVVHAGAMTQVDACEQRQWDCYLVNVEGTVTLLLNAAEYKAFFIFVSSDFVFEGNAGPYREEDELNPVNFYGKTKLEGEESVKEYDHDWAIVRTSLVYGDPGTGKPNILAVVKNKLENKDMYNVVNDQFRSPTYVGDLASGIVTIIERKATGIYHLAGKELLTPYQMACETAVYLGYGSQLINKVTAAGFTQPAKRPVRTDLIIEKARKELNYEPLSFAEGLKKTFPLIT